MQFTFIANACGIFKGSRGTEILTDPWLDDGVFEGSWCHYPPLKTNHKDLQNVDGIYLSHIHPDHYDNRFFKYPLSTPIFILKNKYDFLARNLRKEGYENVIELESGVPYEFNEIKLTIYSPFVGNNYYISELGNLIDSALIVQDENGMCAFNANDNTPDLNACYMLKEKFGIFDLAMINYNAAGPYPSCFRNLSEQEKVAAHKDILKRNIDHMIKCCNILTPQKILPFAGAYVLGGKEHHKNKYLGTTTWDHCAKEIQRLSSHDALVLREGDIYDLKKKESNNPYIPINVKSQKKYISNILSKIIYPYEKDSFVNSKELEDKIFQSVKLLKERCSKYNINVKSKIKIITALNSWIIHEGTPDYGVEIDFHLDERLLLRILKRQSHWNNSEIGCHIEIDRKPNIYEVDAHTMMQFFHL